MYKTLEQSSSCSCLKHCQRPFVRISFSRNFMPWTNKFNTYLIFLFSQLLLLFFFFFCSFFSFFSYQTFFVRVPILKDYPYTLQIFGMQTREKWSLFPSRNNTFSLISSICLLETQVWKYFKIRLVSSEKYKLSLFS